MRKKCRKIHWIISGVVVSIAIIIAVGVGVGVGLRARKEYLKYKAYS